MSRAHKLKLLPLSMTFKAVSSGRIQRPFLIKEKYGATILRPYRHGVLCTARVGRGCGGKINESATGGIGGKTQHVPYSTGGKSLTV
jgi:hypothetical protein